MSKYLGGGGGVASSVNSYPSSTGADALTSTTCDVMAASNVAAVNNVMSSVPLHNESSRDSIGGSSVFSIGMVSCHVIRW